MNCVQIDSIRNILLLISRMQNKKKQPQMMQIKKGSFTIRKWNKKSPMAIMTPQHQKCKMPDLTYTNPKREKVNNSIHEAVLTSKIYIDLKQSYFVTKQLNGAAKAQMEAIILELRQTKQRILQQKAKIDAERQKEEEVIKELRKKIKDAEEWNHLLQYEEEINPDEMTYQQLLELSQKIGYVSKGMSVKVIEKLPQRIITEAKEDKCVVCCSNFEKGQSITKLNKCKHEFHFQCLKEWLQLEKVCPVCKQQIDNQ